MENSKGQSGRSKTATKSCQVTSKQYTAWCGGSPASGSITHQSSSRITPTIRIVHIIAPKIIKTDQANFRALVQKLTGKHSRRPSNKSKQKKCKKELIVKVDHSQAPTDDDNDHFRSKQPGKTEFACYQDQFTASLAQMKEKSVEDDSLISSDSFSEIFGGFGEIDFFTALLGSGSMLPEFPTINLPAVDQADCHSDIFRPPEGAGGLTCFYG